MLPDIDFLWEPWLPNGFISLIAGRVGEGKSGVSLSLAGRILTGCAWPDGQPCNINGPVLWADTESSQSLLVQRAKAWGLPLDQILMPSEGPLEDFRLDNRANWERLVQIARIKHPKLIVLDSLRGAHRGDENSSELQEILSRLANLARDLNVAVLVVHHLRKASDMERKQGDGLTLDQLRGSSAIAALARVVWGIDRPDRSSDVRRLLFLKSNMSSFPHPLGFEVTKEAVNWYEEAPRSPRVETVKDNAEEFLRVCLQKEPILAANIFAEAEQAGVSKRALYEAKKSLRICSVKQQGSGGKWKWSLPAPQLWEEE